MESNLTHRVPPRGKFQIHILNHARGGKATKIGDRQKAGLQAIFKVVYRVGDVIRHIHNLALKTAVLPGASPLHNRFDEWPVIGI